MYWIYNLLITLTSPIWLIWMLVRAKRRAEQPNWAERQGNYVVNLPAGPRVWLHAVSVGEVVAALPVLRALRRLRPDVVIFLTVTTSSGHRTAREQALEKGLVDQVAYFPIDVAQFQLMGISRVRPAVVAIMETELWFNFLWAAKIFGARTLLINGRVSERAFRRGRSVGFFYRSMLRNLDHAVMQTPEDAERLTALGFSGAEVLGNTKFDEGAEAQVDRAEARRRLGLDADDFVVVVGSTRGVEEQDLVAEALLGLEGVKVVHAPRHLETVEALAARVPTAARRSRGETGDYLILDTYGELGWAYSAADVAVVGGGFSDHGGQNLIQPLAAGVPVLRGPHFANFKAVAEASLEASRICTDAASLRSAVLELRENPTERERMAKAGKSLIESHRGAGERYARAILAQL